jgi:muramoyltetrapeptide carboxypeptidase LdcA involved in peptidoglycan recycling
MSRTGSSCRTRRPDLDPPTQVPAAAPVPRPRRHRRHRSDPDDEIVGLTRPGSVVGRLLGGNLSLMATSVGTPTQVDPEDGILFVEEARVRPRVIDRLLTQLRRSGCLLTARGIVLGQFHDCEEPTDDTRSLVDVLSDHLADFDGPVVAGIQAGHGHEQRTLPLGLEVELDGLGRVVRWTVPTQG